MGKCDDIRALWGDALAPVPADLVSLQVSDLTRRVLSTVGLPVESPLGVFYHDQRLRTSPVEVAGRSYLVIGDDHGVLFGIDLDSDQLHQVYPATPSYNRFVNSDLARFLYCYGLLCSRLPELRAAALTGAAEMAGRIEREVAACDAPALAHGRTWWSLVLDMAGEGEL